MSDKMHDLDFFFEEIKQFKIKTEVERKTTKHEDKVYKCSRVEAEKEYVACMLHLTIQGHICDCMKF